MKNNEQTFAFKVAKKSAQKNKIEVENREALAGCTMTQFPWGREPTTDPINRIGDQYIDGGLFC